METVFKAEAGLFANPPIMSLDARWQALKARQP